MPDTLTMNEQEIKQEALTIVQQAQIVKITDQATYDDAASLLLDKIKPFRKRWLEYWSEVKKPAYEAYQKILQKFNEGDKPLELAEKQIKAAISAWDQEQERIRQELQRKAEEEARQREEEQRLQAATLAEESGASEEDVQAVLDAPALAVAPPVEPTYQRATGVSTRENWLGKCTDIKALCRAVGAGKVSTEYVQINQSALNARAKADKGTLNLPGCVAYNQPIIAGRSR